MNNQVLDVEATDRALPTMAFILLSIGRTVEVGWFAHCAMLTAAFQSMSNTISSIADTAVCLACPCWRKPIPLASQQVLPYGSTSPRNYSSGEILYINSMLFCKKSLNQQFFANIFGFSEKNPYICNVRIKNNVQPNKGLVAIPPTIEMVGFLAKLS